ncbi:MAG TPA: tetratricopeptide repeat protein [bacterium]
MTLLKPLSLALGFALMAALALPGCGSREERRDAHFERAKKYLAENKSSEGIIELKNTVQIAPEFAEAYALLGETYLKDQEYRSAFGYYTKAVELEPANPEYVIPLGNLLVAARQFERLDEVLSGLPEETRHTFDVVRLEAAGLQMRDRGEEAASLLKGLLAGENLTPEQRGGVNKALAQMAVKDKQLAAAEEYARAAVTEVPTDVVAILLLSRLQEERGDLAAAEATLTQALTEQTGNLQLTAGLVTFYGRQSRIDDLQRVLQGFVSRGDLSPEGRLFAADTYLRLKNVAEAEKILLAGIETAIPDARLLQGYTRIKAAQGKIDDAVAVIVRAKEKVTAPSTIHYDLAHLYLQLKKAPEAQAVVDEILAADQDNFDGRVMQAQLRLFNQDAQGALDQFRELLKEAPQDAMVHAGLAGAHLVLGESLLARQELEKVVELSPDNTGARIQLARLYLQDQDADTALARLEPFAEMPAPPPEGIDLLIGVLAGTGQVERAHEVIGGLVERFPENPIFAVQQAVLEARTGHVDKGINLLRAQVVKYPKSVPLLVSFAQLLEAANQGDEVIKTYDQILTLQPDHPIAANNLAFRFAEMGRDLGRAEKLAKGLVERFPADVNVADTYAWVLLKKGDKAAAFEVLTKALEGKEAQPVVHYHLAAIAHEVGQTEIAKREIAAALAPNPRGPWVEAAKQLQKGLEG